MEISDKTRLLRRYEGDPTAGTSDSQTPAMDFYSPFGPWIAKAQVPATLIDRINAYADGVITSARSRELILPQSVVSEGGEGSLASQTAALIARFVAHASGGIAEEVNFQVFWIVSQFAGTPSPIHFHSGDISGVLYLKVPELAESAGEHTKTYISGRQAGYLNFLFGGRQQYARSLISFEPQVGDFYIFPGWLLHGAEPFQGTGERRSLAFNAFVPYRDH